jgi:hypothetical protein
MPVITGFHLIICIFVRIVLFSIKDSYLIFEFSQQHEPVWLWYLGGLSLGVVLVSR